MVSRVLTIGTPVDDLHDRRLRAVAAAVERLGALTRTGSAEPEPQAPAPAAELLRTLAAAGRLAVGSDSEGEGPWTLSYVPSAAALAVVASGSASSWGARVDAKHQKALRRAPGAVFRLPYADPATGASTGGTVSVFTTDWSPFTAACAVVVHPDHEALAGSEVRQRPYFTGRFVRHPLHGDLLPVWVADWAKPEFGTGAVVVNPAHSAVDLDFARSIGLPVRFGLGDHEPTADPASWLTPPIIKSGSTVRAGRHDGLTHEEAVQAYLNDLLAAGHADRAESVSLGRVPLAVLTADPGGDVRWASALRARSFTETGALEAGRLATVSASIAAEPLLAAAAGYGAGAPTVVAASDAVTAELLWLRLLMLDLDVKFPPASVVPVARVGAAQGIDPQWLDGALLVAGRTDETVSVKAQVGEQVGRVANDHAAALAAPGDQQSDGNGAKAAAQISATLAAGDFPAAFSTTAAIAKSIRRGTAVGAAERDAFLAAVHVLFGLPLPDDFPAGVLSGVR